MQFDEDEIGDMGFLGCCAPILRTLCCSPCSGKYCTIILTKIYRSARGFNETVRNGKENYDIYVKLIALYTYSMSLTI